MRFYTSRHKPTSLPRDRRKPMMRPVPGIPRTFVLLGVVGLLCVCADQGSAVLPGENGKIAFAGARDGNFEIYGVNPDTTGIARLTNDPSTDTDPAWSSDGRRISFTTTRNGNDDIYLMNADGTGQTQLTTSSAADSNSTWSPLGRNIAFASTRDGDAEIFVMNEDGTGQTQLTNNAVPDATPAWSPDGTRIAFRSERDGNSEIYVMEVDGTDVVRLTTSPAPDVSPAWSPNGQSIAFASLRDGSYEIYVMSADGSDQRRLTRNLDIDLDPAWSPNGRNIAFTSNRDANNEIYVMNADGSNQARLTTNAAEDTTPDWQWQSVVLRPPEPVEDASFAGVHWKESVFFGTLRVRGRVPGLSKLQLALRRGKRVYVAAGLTVSKGAFTKRLALPRDLTPGSFTLEVTAVGSPTELTAQKVPLRLAAPPEGVVSQSWASSVVGGPPLLRVPAANSIAWAHFRFAALPRPSRLLATTWYVDGSKPPHVDSVPKPRRSLVVAWLRPPDGAQLPRGIYTCVLTSGTTVVKRLTFRVS
jgi:Tol biopolymer transport system component